MIKQGLEGRELNSFAFSCSKFLHPFNIYCRSGFIRPMYKCLSFDCNSLFRSLGMLGEYSLAISGADAEILKKSLSESKFPKLLR